MTNHSWLSKSKAGIFATILPDEYRQYVYRKKCRKKTEIRHFTLTQFTNFKQVNRN